MIEHLYISAAHISRKHFKLVRTYIGGKIYWSIEDINSSMGTYLNGHRIPNKEPLSKFLFNKHFELKSRICMNKCNALIYWFIILFYFRIK